MFKVMSFAFMLVHNRFSVMPVTRLSTVGDRAFPEQSAGRCHFVAIAVDIQETTEDRTVCSELSIAPPRLTHCFLLLALLARPFVFFFFVL